MRTLVFLEQHEGELLPDSRGLLARAAALGEADAVIVGSGEELVAGAAAHGAERVFLARGEAFDTPLPQPRVDVLATILAHGEHENVFLSQSVLATDLAAGLAARMEAGLNWGLVDVELRDTELVGLQPAFADTLIAETIWKSTLRLALFRAGAFAPAERPGRGETITIEPELSSFSTAASMSTAAASDGAGGALSAADVVVAGGRGLGTPEAFGVLEGLAEAFDGAVGATRAVVDAGWYPYETQIGQTGKSVSPSLYFAIGLSGAIQHKVGMQSSGTIVAINTDPDAPVFGFSDLAVVGDFTDVVPALTRLVRERRDVQ